MANARNRISTVVLALLTLSCASSSELARRSEVALETHDYERAYRDARSALEKNRGNGRARMVLSAAASHLVDQREQRIQNLAMADSIAAADAAIELYVFRAQAIGWGATLPDHPEFAVQADRIRRGAARQLYAAARASLEQEHPKQAYRELTAVRRYVPGYRDIDTRIPKVWEQAVTRVALLPFDDETGVPELSRAVADRMYAEIGKRVHSESFEFTELVPPDKIYSQMRVSELGSLTRDGAIHLGRTIGARRVVWGRFHQLRTSSDNDRYHGTIWRKFAERDSSGKSVDRFVDVPFDAVERWRKVELKWEFQVIDVESESALAEKSKDLDATAHTVYTSYVPEGDCSNYCLVPPSLKARDSDKATRTEAEWKNTFKSYTVPKLLERAKKDHGRTHYKPDYRHEFIGADADHPVFMDDLPSSDELVLISLDDSWRGVLEVLKALDPED